MALVTEIIPFTVRTGVGTQTINHVVNTGTEGKGYIFLLASNTGTTTGSKMYSIGLSDGLTDLGAAVGIGAPGGVTRTARGFSSVYSVITTQMIGAFSGAQRLLSGYVSATRTGSFDLTFDVNATPGASWFAIMIGGADVSCKVGLYDVSAGSGNVTVGFDVSALVKINVPDAGVNGPDEAGAFLDEGFATQCPNVSDQVGLGILCGAGTPAANYQIADILQANITTAPSGPTAEVIVDSWIANGFSLSMSGTPHTNIGYLAIGGTAVSANLVPILQPTSTGVQNTVIESTNPVLVLFGSTCKTASASPSLDANLMFGAYDGTTQLSQWWGHIDNTSQWDRASSTAHAVHLATATGSGSSTVNAVATAALSSANLALNWTTVDATQRQIWALVLSQNLTGSFSACGINPQGSINVIKHCTPIAGGETEFPFTTTGLTPSSFTLLDGESQLFAAVSPGTYGVSELAPSGWGVTYAVSNGDSHSAITVTGTEAITVTATNTFATTTPTFRIYRRFALPYDEHYFTYLNRLEIVAQMGVGNGASPNPIIRIRFSKDGGSTFGDFRTMSLGAAAQYTKRAYINRVGRGRDLVAELICDDPVVVAWVQCLVEGEKATGTN